MTIATILTSLGAGIVIGSLMDSVEQWMLGMTWAFTRIFGVCAFVVGVGLMLYFRS